MTASTLRKEVSCLALTFFYDYLESRGHPRLVLQQGLPYTPEWLDDKLNWIDYATFLEVERRVAALFPDTPDLFADIGLTFAATKGLGFTRAIVRTLFSPHLVYSRFPSIVSRFLFPFLTIVVTRAGPSEVVCHYTFAPHCPPSQAFLDTVRGILSGVPMIMGAPAAQVRMRRPSDHEAVFDIVISRWTGVFDRLRGWMGLLSSAPALRLKNLNDAAFELEEANRLLQEKVDALTEAKRELDGRVRDLTLLNAASRATGDEMDQRRILQSVTAVVSRELRGAPVVALLSDGDPGGFVVAATAGVSAAERQELRSLARPDGPGAVRLARGISRLKLGGRAWASAPMRSHDRLVGVLLVGLPEGALEAPVLESLAAQLAVSVDNAGSYQMVTELRDNLEIRVRERTAELEEARASLLDTVARLEQADRAKDLFFENISHDLRTPLTLLRGPLEEMEMQLESGDAASLRASLSLARRQTESLDHLVAEILDFALLDAGHLPLSPVDVDLAEIAAEVAEALSPLAQKRGLGLRTDLPESAVGAWADRGLVRRVIVNLLGNALKYTDRGCEVVVRARLEDGLPIVEVVDDGPGIPVADQARIFERFVRGSNPAVPGSGIGLAMAREIAEAHGGAIELESEPGHGACFRVRLQPARGPVAALHPAPLVVLRSTLGDAANLDDDVPPMLYVAPDPEERLGEPLGARVLVVEDNPEMREFLVGVLRHEHRVQSVSDGREAEVVVERELPDVVVSDVMMAHVDGLELCRRLKANVATRGIPVLLVSARHGSKAVLEAFAAGADDYVTKPFSPPELLARVAAQVRIRTLAITLLRLEKQHSLGVLSAGIAHEMLNPVNAVVNAVPPIRRIAARLVAGEAGARDLHQLDALLGAVEASGRRMNDVVRGILAYTRQDPAPRPNCGRLSEEIEAVLTILQYRLTDVVVHRDYAWDEPVLHYPEWVDQVLLNLVVNALDAMEDRGELRIRLHRADDTVCIRIRDDGPGVPPEMRERIFTPFFTTKAPGRGTGLGLAIAREVVALHRGTLRLDPTGGRGAEFVISLPLERPSYAMEA